MYTLRVFKLGNIQDTSGGTMNAVLYPVFKRVNFYLLKSLIRFTLPIYLALDKVQLCLLSRQRWLLYAGRKGRKNFSNDGQATSDS